MKRKNRDRAGKSAVDILEEATHLLRANVFLLAPYYFGSLPFILGLLYFWTDMSTGADAGSVSKASWGLTLIVHLDQNLAESVRTPPHREDQGEPSSVGFRPHDARCCYSDLLSNGGVSRSSYRVYRDVSFLSRRQFPSR